MFRNYDLISDYGDRLLNPRLTLACQPELEWLQNSDLVDCYNNPSPIFSTTSSYPPLVHVEVDLVGNGDLRHKS